MCFTVCFIMCFDFVFYLFLFKDAIIDGTCSLKGFGRFGVMLEVQSFNHDYGYFTNLHFVKMMSCMFFSCKDPQNNLLFCLQMAIVVTLQGDTNAFSARNLPFLNVIGIWVK